MGIAATALHIGVDYTRYSVKGQSVRVPAFPSVSLHQGILLPSGGSRPAAVDGHVSSQGYPLGRCCEICIYNCLSLGSCRARMKNMVGMGAYLI